MSIADELHKLQELHQSGALTDDEFAQAKARVLAAQSRGTEGEPADATLREHLSELQRENELARLDREWDRQREQYQVAGRYGYRYTPSKAGSMITGLIAIGGGTLWTVMAVTMIGGMGGPGALFPLFGVLFILFGIGIALFSFMRANQYEQAYQRYQRRRALIMSAEDDDESAPPSASGRAQPPPSDAIQDLSDPAPCLSCGRSIPAGREKCPHCGWTYQ
jgi:hypothetical protein